MVISVMIIPTSDWPSRTKPLARRTLSRSEPRISCTTGVVWIHNRKAATQLPEGLFSADAIVPECFANQPRISNSARR
jgi:hypothetical protein